MGNISALLPVEWFIGIPLNDSTIRIEIAELSQAILGDKLIGMQVGNEPDLYARHGERPEVGLLRCSSCALRVLFRCVYFYLIHFGLVVWTLGL